jgi:hypothetical protein
MMSVDVQHHEPMTVAFDAMLDEHEAARATGYSVGTLRNLRSSRTGGPPYCKLGAKVRYPAGKLAAWIEANTVTPGEVELQR